MYVLDGRQMEGPFRRCKGLLTTIVANRSRSQTRRCWGAAPSLAHQHRGVSGQAQQ